MMPAPVTVEQVTAPEMPFGIDHVKRHLAIDHDHDDLLIDAYLAAAIARLDGWTGILGMALMPQDLRVTLDAFPCGPLRLPIGPASAVVSVGYRDSAGAAQVMPAQDYTLDAGRLVVWPVASWPATDGKPMAVTVTWSAGRASIPAALEAAILMLTAHFYETRKGDAEMPASVRALVAPYRKRLV